MSTELGHQSILELLPLYVLGALEGAPECDAVCGHLATGCVACADELASLARVTAALPSALPAIAPPAALRAKVEAAVRAAPRAPSALAAVVPLRGTREPLLPRWAFAAAAAVAIVATAWGMSAADDLRRERQQRWGLEKFVTRLQDRQNQLERDATAGREALAMVAAGEATVFTIASADGSAAGSGRIVWHKKNRQWTLLAHDLPPLPEDKAYELWFITGDQKEAIAGGKFRPDEAGLVRYTAPLPAGREDLVIGAVTLEPSIESAEDAAKPAAKPFLVGKAT